MNNKQTLYGEWGYGWIKDGRLHHYVKNNDTYNAICGNENIALEENISPHNFDKNPNPTYCKACKHRLEKHNVI